ncbi:Protein ENHANCED DISEASE RESISTANCE 2-like [Glycine soja]|uniref:Protein ENHANCED DISEASE RESISTANCE 2-like n=1 Tax=Glycine soja TaxID=3848 RepID=A0A445I208_GLYSO|nr:Protein ENHANCED DISEASE RESISTANCE 2-like [Glycine soja]
MLELLLTILAAETLPLLESVPGGQDNCSNGWASPPGAAFKVRGPEYLTTKAKIPAGDYLLNPLGFDWIKSSVKMGEILKHSNSQVRKVIDNEFPAGDKPFVWAFNIQLPTKDNYSAVAYFTNKEPITEGSLMDNFLKGDDAFRNSRLKMIANIVNENFVEEVDIDIGSSMVAAAIVHLAFGYVTTLTVDLAFLIESQTESDFPENLLGAFRFSNLNPASARQIDPSSVLSTGGLQKSLSKRLWKSIGQILLPGSKEDDSTSGSQNTKTVDHKNVRVTSRNDIQEELKGKESPFQVVIVLTIYFSLRGQGILRKT